MKILKEGFFEQKERLATASEKFKEKIKHDIGGSIGKIERATIAGLIITGSLVLAYKFTKTLIPGRETEKSKPKKKPAISEAVKEEGDGSGFLKGVLEIISLFILVIAKEKLEEFIHGEDQ